MPVLSRTLEASRDGWTAKNWKRPSADRARRRRTTTTVVKPRRRRRRRRPRRRTLPFENRPGRLRRGKRRRRPPVLACRRPRKGGRRAGPASESRTKAEAETFVTRRSSRRILGNDDRAETRIAAELPVKRRTTTNRVEPALRRYPRKDILIQTDWPPSLARAASTDRPDWPALQSQSFSRSYGSNLPTSLTYINLATRD